MTEEPITASIIFAAGKGSRMKEFDGNKTLLPLKPGKSPFEGDYPILLQVLKNLPPGPKALVVNHRKEDIIEATMDLGIHYYEQPALNGTGGALIASGNFLRNTNFHRLIITMGDVPLVRPETFQMLLDKLDNSPFVILGFQPEDKKTYGILEMDREKNVKRIIEWKYWSKFSKEDQDRFDTCNSGIYAAKKDTLIKYMSMLEKHPHLVKKERNGKIVELEEFFITDLIEYMYKDGLKVGYIIARDEYEIMGVDDPDSLKKAQEIFRHRFRYGTG